MRLPALYLSLLREVICTHLINWPSECCSKEKKKKDNSHIFFLLDNCTLAQWPYRVHHSQHYLLRSGNSKWMMIYTHRELLIFTSLDLLKDIKNCHQERPSHFTWLLLFPDWPLAFSIKAPFMAVSPGTHGSFMPRGATEGFHTWRLAWLKGILTSVTLSHYDFAASQ